ncbi:MAG: hypothetical protein IT177_25430 [Acidobacteria bacterium]|nr:hypothetical protein [Acidobacteriota bacterium]
MNARLAVRVTQLALVVGPLVLCALVRDRPPWGDEAHFLDTVRLFGEGISFDLFRSYPEMSGPLTFAIYGAWGRLAGFGTAELRLLSPLIASATALVWFAFLRDRLRSCTVVGLALATLVLNPYFIGLSVFVFTDMLALLGLGLALLGTSRRQPWLSVVGLAIATCTRQYLAFMAPAMVAAALVSREDRQPVLRRAWPAVVGMVPLGLLVLLWQGQLAPANAIRASYLSEGIRFDPHALSLYLSSPALYLCLVVWPVARRASRAAIALVATLGVFVWSFPVQPSAAQTREGSFTVGFLHRAADWALPEPGVALVFVLLAVLNGLALAHGARETLARWRMGRFGEAEALLWAGAAAFLIVMPFSYMPWEKYALPLFMLQGAALAMVMDRGGRRSTSTDRVP